MEIGENRALPYYGFIEQTNLRELRELLFSMGLSNFSGEKGRNYLKGLFLHFDIMVTYFLSLLKKYSFTRLVRDATGFRNPRDMKVFLQVLVYAHDFGRLIFEPGNLNLRDNDKRSEELLDGFLSSIYNQEEVEKIKACLHSIGWITGEKELPKSDDQLSPQQRLALILKAVDTIGKNSFDERGRLIFRHPDIFFDEDGDYQRWLEYQKDNHRFPIPLDGGRFIDAQEYARRDRKLTLRGVNLIKQILSQENAEVPGEEFDAFWLEVQQEFVKLHSNL